MVSDVGSSPLKNSSLLHTQGQTGFLVLLDRESVVLVLLKIFPFCSLFSLLPACLGKTYCNSQSSGAYLTTYYSTCHHKIMTPEALSCCHLFTQKKNVRLQYTRKDCYDNTRRKNNMAPNTPSEVFGRPLRQADDSLWRKKAPCQQLSPLLTHYSSECRRRFAEEILDCCLIFNQKYQNIKIS